MSKMVYNSNIEGKRLMKSNAKYIFNLKEEKKILERSLNLYYFDKNKRALLFTRLERVSAEIERVENNANYDNGKPSNKEKS